ncbi:MFS transporter [Streptomyces sp. DSM 40750]|uniref:MFS transporter n=1 Tax=Streptomyces sp. DSM 40750 TaxID=2801030 RepID=UPI00214ADDEE|nr:MFS transporter [Streptomyces sp. DSM 40750]UUU23029.1 MFS transporter [Streptomyces sp. DSM 40750]
MVGAGRALGREFRWLWAAFAVSSFGTRLAFDAFPLIAVLVLDVGPTEVSALAATGLAVGAAVAVPLGPWVEFRRKRPVMITMDLVRCATLLTVPTAYALDLLTFPQLLLVSTVVAAADITFTAASGACLKSLVPPEHLLAANGRLEATTWTATMLGPPLGGAALGIFGPVTTLVADAISYLLSAAGIRAIGGREPRPTRHGALREPAPGNDPRPEPAPETGPQPNPATRTSPQPEPAPKTGPQPKPAPQTGPQPKPAPQKPATETIPPQESDPGSEPPRELDPGNAPPREPDPGSAPPLEPSSQRPAPGNGPRPTPAPRLRPGDLLDGWRYILTNPALRPLFLNTLLVNALIMVASPLMLVLMVGQLGFSAWQYGLAFAVPCVGGLIGSRLSRRLVARYGHRRVLLTAGTLRACWPLGLAFVGPGAAGLVLVMVVELGLITCIGVYNPVLATQRLNETPPDRVVRTLSAWSVTSKLTTAALTALWGLLAAATTPRTAITAAGVLLLATPLLLLPHRRPTRPTESTLKTPQRPRNPQNPRNPRNLPKT